jgi:RND family efflux transporter MFP subunit
MSSARIRLRTWTTVPAICLLLACAGCGGEASHAARPPEVEVSPVIRQDVKIYSEWVATLQGYVNAQIQPEVTGYLIKQDYREGSYVHKNDVLFEIDPRPFQAALDMAKAQLAQDEAELGNARLNVKRDIPEAQVNAIPHMQLETDMQSRLAAQAAVEAGSAAVEQAELNLGFTKVRSLISGIAGIAQVQVGNLVTPATVLTGVSDVNPIKAYFPVSADEYLRIADRINPDTVDLLSSTAAIPLQLILSSGRAYAHPGSILFADRAIDQQTGTIQIVGAFANPGNILRPGQYGKVRAVTEVLKGALLIPQRAVSELQGSYQVAVVDPDDKVAIRSVQVGERVGSMWVIASGLEPGERVVAEGAQNVADGSTVTPVPYESIAGGEVGALGE